MTRNDAGDLGRRALALLVMLACLAPPVYLLVWSVAGPWPFPRLLPAGWTFERWRGLLGDAGGLATSVAGSILLSAAVAGVSTAFGFVTAREVARHPWRRALLFLAYVPFVLSPVILATCLLYVFLRLRLAGNVAGVACAQLLLGYGFAVVFFQGFWNTEKKALGELVATLGGTEWQLYRRVYLPLGRELLWIGFFQVFLLSFFQYGSTVLIGSGNVKTLPVAVYYFIGEANPGYAAVASVLLILPPMLLVWLNRRFVFRAVA